MCADNALPDRARGFTGAGTIQRDNATVSMGVNGVNSCGHVAQGGLGRGGDHARDQGATGSAAR